MGVAYKQLGESAPGATTLTDLYTVPALTSAVVSSLSVCNRGGTATTFRVKLAIAGAADANAHALYYDAPIGANDTLILTAGICLAATDRIRVYAGNANLSFRAWGQEIS